MKHYAMCHMVYRLDGRTLRSRWKPDGCDIGDLFEDLDDKLEGDAWVVSRVAEQEFAKGKDYATDCGTQFPAKPDLPAGKRMPSVSSPREG